MKRFGAGYLRTLSFCSALLFFFHAALLPIFWGVESVFFFGLPAELKTIKTMLVFSGLVTLMTFCLSTQHYLAAKRTADTDSENMK